MIDTKSLQVGDKIIVDPHLHKGFDYNLYVSDTMTEYVGNCVTVSKIFETCILIEEDGGSWWWSNDMFFPYETTPQIKLSDYIM